MSQSPDIQTVVSYDAPWNIYGIDWCNYGEQSDSQRLLLSSFREDYSNAIQVRKDSGE